MASRNLGKKSPRRKPYRASLHYKGKTYFLGSYATRREAERVEEEAKKNKEEYVRMRESGL
jgi:hypothetical protein